MMRYLSVVGLALAATAFGDTIQFQSLPANTQYGTYNGFLTAAVNGVDSELVCDDYLHTTYVPSGPFTYEVSTLTGANPLQYARFVNPNDWSQSVTQYEEAAYLVLQLTQQSAPHDLTADYQYALWSLFTPSTPIQGTYASALLSQAAAAVSTAQIDPLLYSRLRIYTPITPYTSNQEFLGLSDPSSESPGDLASQAAPEPATSVLLCAGAGLVVTGVLLKKLRRILQQYRLKRS
ncbi:MAG TPA: PEP-CTERM sorting domain-containing protein [Candidatus Acidoferrales bacterium]|nr:PEP-CTERM sorting domain-containing protein [Candidatus Acidoferrales bacterium]